MKPRKFLRDAIRAIMADATTGFNATLASIAVSYGIAPFVIDWVPPSRSLFQGFLFADQVLIAELIDFPACVLYTSASANQNFEKFRRFSGLITAHLDFYIDQGSGIEVSQTEDVPDAIEDVLIQIFNSPTVNLPSGIAWNGGIQSQRGPIRLVGDGYQQRIPFNLTFEVDV